MEYKVLGYSADAIAKTLGIKERRVYEIVAEELDRLRTETRMSAEQYREMQLQQIARMVAGLMPSAAGVSMFDVDQVIKLHQEQRRRLLRKEHGTQC
jgi:hypothetical protein